MAHSAKAAHYGAARGRSRIRLFEKRREEAMLEQTYDYEWMHDRGQIGHIVGEVVALACEAKLDFFAVFVFDFLFIYAFFLFRVLVFVKTGRLEFMY